MTDIKTLFEKTKDNKDPEFQAQVDEILQEFEVTKGAIDKLYGSTDALGFTTSLTETISNLATCVEEKNVEDTPEESNTSDEIEKRDSVIEVENGSIIRVAGLTAEEAEILNEHRAQRKMTTFLRIHVLTSNERHDL